MGGEGGKRESHPLFLFWTASQQLPEYKEMEDDAIPTKKT